MATVTAIDRSFCWETVQRTRPELRISHAYAHPAHSDRILALHAWLSAVETTVSVPSDTQVARAKLEWWRAELLDRSPSESAHPIVRFLVRSGCLERLPKILLQTELLLADRRIDRCAVPSRDALKDLCLGIGNSQMSLELAITEQMPSEDETTSSCMRLNGLVQLLRESLRSSRLGLWWAPLDHCARFGIARDIRLDAELRPQVRTLLDSVCREVFSWGPVWGAVHGSRVCDSATLGDTQRFSRHWYIYSRLLARQLARFHRLVIADRALELKPSWMGDTLLAWRFARQIGEHRERR